MADEYKFPMRLRCAMERAATVLTNCADIRRRELDEDSQGHLRGVLDDLDQACIEANMAVPTWHKPVRAAEVAAASASQGYAHSLADLQAEALERCGMLPDKTLAAAQGLYKRNLITNPITEERRLAQFMFEEAASLINSYKFVSGRSEYDAEYEAPCWTRDLEGIDMGIMPRGMPAAALFGFCMSEAESCIYGLVHARFLSLFIRPGA